MQDLPARSGWISSDQRLLVGSGRDDPVLGIRATKLVIRWQLAIITSKNQWQWKIPWKSSCSALIRQRDSKGYGTSQLTWPCGAQWVHALTPHSCQLATHFSCNMQNNFVGSFISDFFSVYLRWKNVSNSLVSAFQMLKITSQLSVQTGAVGNRHPYQALPSTHAKWIQVAHLHPKCWFLHSTSIPTHSWDGQ